MSYTLLASLEINDNNLSETKVRIDNDKLKALPVQAQQDVLYHLQQANKLLLASTEFQTEGSVC